MRNVIIIFVVVYISKCIAQHDSLQIQTDSLCVQDTLDFKTIAGLNFSQVSFSNWSQGGDNVIAISASLNPLLEYKSPGWRMLHQVVAVFGKTKTGSGYFITTDNEIYFESVYSLNIGWKTDPFFGINIRTPITSGFDYKKDPPEKTADFFDPAYITQSIGFNYEKQKVFKSRLGVGVQVIVTDNHRHYTDDPETENEIENLKIESGLESISSLNLFFWNHVSIKTNCRLFTTFKKPDVWDVRFENTIAYVASEYVNFNFNILVIYQRDQSAKTQVKEKMQLGLTYRIF